MTNHLSSNDGKQIQPWDQDLDRVIDILEQHGYGTKPPTDAELAAAPRIEYWGLVHIGELPMLTGAMYGDGGKDGLIGFTPPVIKLDEAGGWVKTVGRYYRLGERIERPA